MKISRAPHTFLLCPILTVKPLNLSQPTLWMSATPNDCTEPANAAFEIGQTVRRCFPPDNELHPIANRAINRLE